MPTRSDIVENELEQQEVEKILNLIDELVLNEDKDLSTSAKVLADKLKMMRFSIDNSQDKDIMIVANYYAKLNNLSLDTAISKITKAICYTLSNKGCFFDDVTRYSSYYDITEDDDSIFKNAFKSNGLLLSDIIYDVKHDKYKGNLNVVKEEGKRVRLDKVYSIRATKVKKSGEDYFDVVYCFIHPLSLILNLNLRVRFLSLSQNASNGILYFNSSCEAHSFLDKLIENKLIPNTIEGLEVVEESIEENISLIGDYLKVNINLGNAYILYDNFKDSYDNLIYSIDGQRNPLSEDISIYDIFHQDK